MTLGGVFGLVVLGKTARRLGRRKASAQPVSQDVPQSSKNVASQKYEVEETYTYLESQIRDVCAGLPSGVRSANGVQG